MNNLSRKTKQFVDKIFSATLSEKLNWETGFDDDEIYFSSKDTTVHLVRMPSFDEFQEPDYLLLIKNKHGSIIDRIDHNTLASETPELGTTFKNYYKLLQSLFDTATRQANNVSGVLDDLLDFIPD